MQNWTCGFADLLHLCDFGERGSLLFCPPATGKYPHLSGRQVEAPVGRNNSEHNKDKCPGFSDIVTGSEGASLYVRRRSHQFVSYPEDVKGRPAKEMKIEGVIFPPDSVNIGHGYL